MLKKIIKNGVAFFVPPTLVRRVRKKKLRAIKECIRNLEVIDKESLSLNNVELRAIRLSTGHEIIGHLPTKMEVLLCGDEAMAKGLGESYTKVLIDAITRYQYPHIGVAFQILPYPATQRFLFHPQHFNYIAEDVTISSNSIEEIARIFTPAKGWRVLDVGAYLGHGALQLCSQVGPSGVVHCVEANTNNSLVISEMIKRNNIENIWVKNAAIWRSSGEDIYLQNSYRQANAIDPGIVYGEVSCRVKTTSLSELTTEMGCAADLVSLTVNGAEIEAVQGLFDVPIEKLPKRVLAPGWYLKDGVRRSGYLTASLRGLGYSVVKTSGDLVIAWRPGEV